MDSWGQELIIDARHGNDNAQSIEEITRFVEDLVVKIDMVPYGPLWIARFATHDAEKTGISFCQMIETSNLTGHFCDKDNSFYLNIFSCKDFEISTVVELVNERFGTEHKNLNVRLLRRDANNF